MSLYDCDYDSCNDWMYRERIELSDGTIVCCESGIVIPKGQPFAMCVPVWTDENRTAFCDMSAEEREVWFAKTKPMPQALEVWRLLRRNNFRHGACAAFGDALDAYQCTAEEYRGEDEGGVHAGRYRELLGVIKRAKARYESGGGPRLHPTERASMESGTWQEELPYSIQKKVPA